MQTKLRNELLEHDADPTYDQLSNGLFYLDAVAHEVLRLHPPAGEIIRVVRPPLTSLIPSLSCIVRPQAIEDDVIPLSEPVRTKHGELIDSLTIAKGTLIVISMASMNRSAAFWGEDAKVFRPSRWLEDAHGQNGIPAEAKEIQGHRHLLTFADGQRTCLGRKFVVTEIKVRVGGPPDSDDRDASLGRRCWRCSSGTLSLSCVMVSIPRLKSGEGCFRDPRLRARWGASCLCACDRTLAEVGAVECRVCIISCLYTSRYMYELSS